MKIAGRRRYNAQFSNSYSLSFISVNKLLFSVQYLGRFTVHHHFHSVYPMFNISTQPDDGSNC